jgi:alpha-L-fucosidase
MGTRLTLLLTASLAAAFASTLVWGQGPASGAAVAPSAVQARAELTARVAKQGPFAPDWNSLEKYTVPDWYQDAKFGIFIHWGVYSVPAFGNEWYPRDMYRQGQKAFAHHVATWGPQSTFGYKDFIPRFTGEKFDAAKWAALFKAAGARYVVPVAEHHDGFAMYDSDFSRWTAAKMGPHRDVIGELAKAVRGEGLVFGLSSHRVEHWWFFGEGRKFDSDVRDPAYEDFYGPAADREASEAQKTPPTKAFLDDWLARCSELVDKYHPQLVWFDWWIAQPAVQPSLKTFAAFYYNRGAEWKTGVAINYKKHGGESFPDTAGVLDVERGQLAGIRPLFWQTDTSVSKNSWGYVQNQDYKTADSLIDDLIDIVSKNGALLLNVGPRPDGTIPEPEERMLREIGGWLSVNGEAIYGTRPWTTFGEGPTAVVEGPFADTKRLAFTDADIRFTTKAGVLYALALAWPASGVVHIKTLGSGSTSMTKTIADVEQLGAASKVPWTRDADGLHIRVGATPSSTPQAVAFRIRSGTASERSR